MAIDTFVVFVGVYGDVEDAEADYKAVKDLHTEAGLLDAYDAAVIVHREDGKVKITKKHETPTRSAACSVAGSAWRPASSWPSSRSRRSVAACCSVRPLVGRCSAPWPATPRPA